MCGLLGIVRSSEGTVPCSSVKLGSGGEAESGGGVGLEGAVDDVGESAFENAAPILRST